jgi:rod shape-determining protein MreC
MVTTFLAHEARALFFFHRSYWQNMRLREEVARLTSESLERSRDDAELSRLRELLDYKQSVSFQTLTARVIGKDFGAVKSYLILDKGSADGVEKYAPVLTARGLVGKVIETGRRASRVILMNDPDLSVPAQNLRSREQGLVSGALDGRCKLRFLDLDSDVQEGDVVVTSGLNMTFPEGIVLGKVKWIGVESSGLGKFAILEPAERLWALEEVLVVAGAERSQ